MCVTKLLFISELLPNMKPVLRLKETNFSLFPTPFSAATNSMLQEERGCSELAGN